MTDTLDAIAREMRTALRHNDYESDWIKDWAARIEAITALSNQGEGAETEESIAADCYFHIGEMVGTLRGGSVTEHVQTILEVLGECSEYMHNIPESVAGGSDEAVRIAKNLRDCLSGTIADVELHPAEADRRDAELPGMWEAADLSGGATDAIADRTDTQRLDWLAFHGASMRNDDGMEGGGWFVLAPYHTGIASVDGRIRFKTVREAIDAATQEQT